MGVIRKKNPQTGEWEIFGSTDAKDINLIDTLDNFTDKNVEGALRELADDTNTNKTTLNAQGKVIQDHSNKLNQQQRLIAQQQQLIAQHQEDIEWLKVNGGGGGGTAAPTITSSFEDGTIVEKGQDVKIPIFFSSPNQGNGTAYILINDVEVGSVSNIKQGNNTINIGKLTELHNTVGIYVKDRANMLSNQLSWNIICGGLDVTIDFDDTADYTITDPIVMQYTVETASTEPIICHMTIDYTELEFTCEVGVNEYTFPEMGIGVHKVKFYFTSGRYQTSMYNFNIVVVSSNSLYVSSTFEGGQFNYGTPIAIMYRISKASTETFNVKLYLDSQLEKTLDSPVGSYSWTLNKVAIGNHTAKIEVRSDYGEYQYLELNFEVVATEYTPQEINKQGLVYRLSAQGRTNQDSDRAEPTLDSEVTVKTTLHNFNWYTNGWIDGELICNGNAYVEIDYYPWKDNAIYGSTIEIQYEANDIGFTNARVIDYTDIERPYKGFYIDLEESTMKSLANTGKVNVDKDVYTTLSFVIDRKNKFGKIFIDGICSRAFSLSDSGSGTSATREDFTHNQKIYLNSRKGSDMFGACKIKDVRIYNRVLSDDEIVKNNIAQIEDLEEQERVYNFNYNNTTLPTIRMYGDTTNMTLETPVSMRIKYTSPNEDKYGQSFDLPYCQVNWQGTSSLQYVLKNFTARLKDENMAPYEYTPYPNGIPNDTFCFKAD